MKDWYCYINNQIYGPYPEDILRGFIDRGQLTVDTYVYNDSSEEASKGWQRACDTEIATLFMNDSQRTQPLPPIQNQEATHVSLEVPEKNAANSRYQLSDESEGQTFPSNGAYEPGSHQFEEETKSEKLSVMNIIVDIVGILACLLATDGLHRFGRLVAAFGGEDAPFYTTMFIISLLTIILFILSLIGKLNKIAKWIGVVLLAGCTLLMLVAPQFPVTNQIFVGFIVGTVCLFFARIKRSQVNFQHANQNNQKTRFFKKIVLVSSVCAVLILALTMLAWNSQQSYAPTSKNIKTPDKDGGTASQKTTNTPTPTLAVGTSVAGVDGFSGKWVNSKISVQMGEEKQEIKLPLPEESCGTLEFRNGKAYLILETDYDPQELTYKASGNKLVIDVPAKEKERGLSSMEIYFEGDKLILEMGGEDGGQKLLAKFYYLKPGEIKRNIVDNNGWRVETFGGITFQINASWKKEFGEDGNARLYRYLPPTTYRTGFIQIKRYNQKIGNLSDAESRTFWDNMLSGMMRGEKLYNREEIGRTYFKIGDNHAVRFKMNFDFDANDNGINDDERYVMDSVTILFEDGVTNLCYVFTLPDYEISYKNIAETTLNSVQLAKSVAKPAKPSASTPAQSAGEDTVFRPRDVSDKTIKSISTYNDYLVMYQMILEDYFAQYEAAIKGTMLYDKESFNQLKQSYIEAFEQQKKMYAPMGKMKIVGKDDLVDMLIDLRDSLREYVEILNVF
jgi:hypothetical protein